MVIPSFRSPIIQDWVFGSFFVQAVDVRFCTILVYASGVNKIRKETV
ncbi:MAG: hypothetical protein ACP5N0_13790 [Methanosarcina sp.]